MHHPLLTVKLAFIMLVACIGLVVVGGAALLRNAPQLTNDAIISSLRRGWYVVEMNGARALAGAPFAHVRTYHNSGPLSSIPVLVYHGVTREPDGTATNVTEAEFLDHMRALHTAGYRTISLKDLYRFKAGTFAPSGKIVVITFDDGRRDSFYGADPALASVRFSAAMFAISKYSENDFLEGYYLSAPELRRMARTGRWEIGGHAHDGHADFPIDASGTLDHYYGNRLWITAQHRQESYPEYAQRVGDDLSTAKRILTEVTGRAPTAFAFPFGDMGQNTTEDPRLSELLISRAAPLYTLLFYQQWPGEYFTQTLAGEKPASGGTYRIRRIEVGAGSTGESLLARLRQGDPKPLPYGDALAPGAGWVRAWGEFALPQRPGDTMTLAALSSQTGASAILDGTGHWRDYAVAIEAASPHETGVTIFVRFQSDRDNAQCNFGKHFAHVEQVVGGEKRVIKGARTENIIPEGRFSAEARVSGRTVSCFINGELVVASEFLDPALDRGGIGLKIWDEAPGTALLHVSDFLVKEIEPEARPSIGDS